MKTFPKRQHILFVNFRRKIAYSGYTSIISAEKCSGTNMKHTLSTDVYVKNQQYTQIQ